MARTYDGRTLTKVMKLYWWVQAGLLLLLVFMAVNFQAGLAAEGRPERFLHSVIVAIVLQLLAFYPLKRFAAGEVERDLLSTAGDLTAEEQKDIRRKRIFSDYLKWAIIIFFVTFAWLAPPDRFILSAIFISFILTILTYLQCYNFLAKRAIREQGS
jgi:hypothetical protein